MNNFTNLKLSTSFQNNLNILGYQELTKIQNLALPHILEGHDVIARAKTGSGKTVAFSLPLVKNLDVKNFKIQSLVIAPTRELVNQIALEIRKLSQFIHNVKVLTLTGGVPYKPQVSSLYHGAHIIVATPGRLLKHLKEENINFDELNFLVLDEADKMLDMGFYDDILEIIETLPKKRQTLLFSATYEDNIKTLGENILNDAKFIEDEKEEKTFINQEFIEAGDKGLLIPRLIKSNKAKSTLVFCNTKIECENLADYLYDQGLDALTIHSDLEQKDRDEILTIFANRSYPILIATDVASRGLHIDDIDLVINYDLARDEKVHKHRIGRTARAGKGGKAVSLYGSFELDDANDLKEFFDDIPFINEDDIIDDESFKIDSDYRTLFINGGKKQKLRKGDILGALTAGIGLNKDSIGKIDSFDFRSYVAIKKEQVEKAHEGLSNNRIKGKFFKIYQK
jgi:ATP-independent RNA helicase DbpA